MIKANDYYTQNLLHLISTANIFTLDELFRVIIKDLPVYQNGAVLLVIDSLTAAYRPASGPITSTLLRKALSALKSLALKSGLAVLFTNQVAAMVDTSDAYRPVASASTRSFSDVTVRLARKNNGQTETIFEDMEGEEEEALEPFAISPAGIETFEQLFSIKKKEEK